MGPIWAHMGPIWAHMGPYGPLWAHMAQKHKKPASLRGGWRDTIKGGMEKMKDANIVGDDCVKLLGWFKIAFQLAFQTF